MAKRNRNGRLVLCRKEHVCSLCEKPIEKGSWAFLFECRTGKYDDKDLQVGIDYIVWREHAFTCVAKPPELTPEEIAAALNWELNKEHAYPQGAQNFSW